MTIWQRWKQTAIHNKALVVTSVLVAFGTVFYAGAAAFQVWLMVESGKHTDEQIGYVIGNVNWLARSMDASQKSTERAMREQVAKMQLQVDQVRQSNNLAEDAIRQASTESAENARRVNQQLGILQNQVEASRAQAQAAFRSADAIAQQTEISERPWLTVEAEPGSDLFYVNGKQAGMTFRFTIRNLGRSIAKNVHFKIKFASTRPIGIPIAVESARTQQETCDSPTAQDLAFDVFPTGNPIIREISTSVSPSDIEANKASTSENSDFIGFYVVGCITYSASFATQNIHKTFFAYHLMNPSLGTSPPKLSNGIPDMVDFAVGKEIPQKDVGIEQEILARNEAE